MCYSWKHPTRSAEEFKPEILEKIPAGMKRLNITGGEPLLRSDIIDIASILNAKTNRLEISTNGYFTDRIVKIAESFPHITIRVSVEGLPQLNDKLRGLKNGFDNALSTILKLKSMKMKDIGFATVISHKNIQDLLALYTLASGLEVEFSQSTMHSSFYFHKQDNRLEDIDRIKTTMREFIERLLNSRRKNLRMRIKDWFRAYINFGLLRFIEGKDRLLACGAGTDSFFVDPWGRILACNGSSEPWVMGDLTVHDFDEIWHSEKAEKVRRLVRECKRNCWMTGTSVPAMRRHFWSPLFWILKNKVRLYFGYRIITD
jgi:MoaA/NifB/PqqE/SkfB family radical SAM enzyme